MSIAAGMKDERIQEAEAGFSRLPRYAIRNYRLPAKVFHWVTASLVLLMVLMGVTMVQLGGGPVGDTLFVFHKTIGVLLLGIVLLRIFYRLARLETGEPQASHRRAVLHWMLYGAVLLMPILGWSGVSDYDSLGIVFGYSLPVIWPKGAGYGQLLLDAHAYLAFVLLALVALHIGVAMQDHMMRARDPARPDD